MNTEGRKITLVIQQLLKNSVYTVVEICPVYEVKDMYIGNVHRKLYKTWLIRHQKAFDKLVAHLELRLFTVKQGHKRYHARKSTNNVAYGRTQARQR